MRKILDRGNTNAFPLCLYLMMRWIPKDAGYISKVPISGLEDNGTHICLKNDDKLGLDVIQIITYAYLRPRKIDRCPKTRKIGLGRFAMPPSSQRSHYFQIPPTCIYNFAICYRFAVFWPVLFFNRGCGVAL